MALILPLQTDVSSLNKVKFQVNGTQEAKIMEGHLMGYLFLSCKWNINLMYNNMEYFRSLDMKLIQSYQKKKNYFGHLIESHHWFEYPIKCNEFKKKNCHIELMFDSLILQEIRTKNPAFVKYENEYNFEYIIIRMKRTWITYIQNGCTSFVYQKNIKSVKEGNQLQMIIFATGNKMIQNNKQLQPSTSSKPQKVRASKYIRHILELKKDINLFTELKKLNNPKYTVKRCEQFQNFVNYLKQWDISKEQILSPNPLNLSVKRYQKGKYMRIEFKEYGQLLVEHDKGQLFAAKYRNVTLAEYCSKIHQPVAIFTIKQYSHIRQYIKIDNNHCYNKLKWDINLNRLISYVRLNKIIMGELKYKCSNIVNNNFISNVKDLKFSQRNSLSRIIDQLKSVTNTGVICNILINYETRSFPSTNDQGINCLIFIKSGDIINKKWGKNGSSMKVGKKIKIKLMFNDSVWKKNRDFRILTQILSHRLCKFIAVKKFVHIGDVWNGTWYCPKEELINTKCLAISWNRFAYHLKYVQKFLLYIDYQLKDKPIKNFEQEMKNANSNIDMKVNDNVDGENIQKIKIGAIVFKNIWSWYTHSYFKNNIRALFDNQSLLKQLGKLEYNAKMNRFKWWCKACIYLYEGDRTRLGDECFDRAMKIARGVRTEDNCSLPKVIDELHYGLIESGVINKAPDQTAMNLYINTSNDFVSSGIESHNESDRFSNVVSVTFTSHCNISTVLSINQPSLHQTSDLEIPSNDGQIIVWDMNGFSMRKGHTHGIDKENLRLPPKSWRLIILLRDLQVGIKEIADRHKIFCKNQDSNINVLKNCKCQPIK